VKPKEINIAIADACFPDFLEVIEIDGVLRIHQGEFSGTPIKQVLPDYFNDLNAMQSAVCSQSSGFQIDFDHRLRTHAECIGCMVHQVSCADWSVIFVSIKRG